MEFKNHPFSIKRKSALTATLRARTPDVVQPSAARPVTQEGHSAVELGSQKFHVCRLVSRGTAKKTKEAVALTRKKIENFHKLKIE